MSAATLVVNLEAESPMEALKSQQYRRRRAVMSQMPSGVSVSLLSQFSESVARLRSFAISLRDTRKSFEFETSRKNWGTLGSTLEKLKELSGE
jgi:hypothetical protein